MRKCRSVYSFRWVGPGPDPADKRKEQPKKRKGLRYEEMNMEQRRKVDAIRRKAAEVNQDGRIFQGTEMRAY